MDTQVPAVVAVVVTTDPGPWFDEALASLAAQDYEELSVLVLATGDGADPSDRVARHLPNAFVRQLPGKSGYGAAANEALGMVEGAAFFLLCHDDCVLDPDVVHIMVEESFRSNAGVVSPKFVNWDDPTVLLHVGMSCDKTGAVVDRIQDGEVDHGQHDAVRDVFVAPGGCTLIRADLWRELGGFDAGIVAMGEDLDLSWRSQVVGSRVVVAPDARVRHREVVAAGLATLAVVNEDDGDSPVTLQGLQRRHELRTVLKCYTWFHLIRVLPQAVLLNSGEVVVALFARDRQRARAVVGAWTWNARHLSELRALRRSLKAHRLFPDSEVRRLQLHGSARLSQYISRLSHQGLDAANAVVSGRRAGDVEEGEPDIALLTGSVGLAFSEDSDFDDLDDMGHRSGRDRFGRQVRRPPLSTGRQRVTTAVIAALVILIGTREIFFGSLPLIGQLAPLLSWSSTWHHFFSGWQSAGVGTTAPASPAFGFIGLAGTVLFGAMSLVQKVLLLGCIPLGAIGMSRFVRPVLSPRARLIAVVCYMGLPLPYDALGSGRWDGLVAYAAFPFILARLARAARLKPFDAVESSGWRASTRGQIAFLGGIIAIAASFAPAVLPMTLVCAVALALGSLLVRSPAENWRVVLVAAGAVVVALVLDLPWVVGTALAGKRAVEIFGLPVGPSTAPSWGEVMRFAIGPAARSPIVLLLVGAAALPLLLGSDTRLIWAARLWVMACASWGLALASTHGWTGAFTPSESVVLAPAAVAVAACVGLGVAAFENDVVAESFGWRQIVSGLAVIAVVLGLVPVAAGAVGGRWALPTSGVEQPLAFLNRPATAAAYRVLWLGDPRALPEGGWSIQPGLSYSLTGEALPDAEDTWTPAGPGPAQLVADALHLAITGGTVHLGRLLAAQGVLYVVVVDGLAPSDTSLTPSVDAPPPIGIKRAMLNQNDLQTVPGELGVQVYKNTEPIPVTAERAAPALAPTGVLSWPGPVDVAGWAPVLSALDEPHGASGAVSAGTVFAGYAPAGDFTLSAGGKDSREQPAFGWAAEYPSVPAGPATLSFHQFPFVPLVVLVELVGWVLLSIALLGWRPRRLRVPATREEP